MDSRSVFAGGRVVVLHRAPGGRGHVRDEYLVRGQRRAPGVVFHRLRRGRRGRLVRDEI